jgi:RNA polymerase sigma-70 factor, ECF subfamily
VSRAGQLDADPKSFRPVTRNPSQTDQELLERVRAEDPEALAELVERYAPRVLRFGIKMCRDEEDAREIVQDTLLAAARGLRDFRGTSAVSTWLYAIARSFCIKRRTRGAAAHGEHQPIDAVSEAAHPELVETEKTPEQQASARQLEAALENAIGGLEAAYREVLVLRDVEGLTAPEVAEVLGVSVEAVKSRLHRARSRVRHELAPLLAAEPAAAREPTCPDVVDMLSRHAEGDIEDSVCREMEQHVAACPRCAARCESLERVLSLCRAAPVPGVPADVKRALQESLRQALRSAAG